ncbi:MAG: divergent PAP2 family protein [Spirochaetota bacterium]
MVVAYSLITAVSAQIASQLYKVLTASIRHRRLELKPFVHTGGMPSAHSAFVTALTVSVGLSSGFDSDAFAVSAVFSLIIIYDALRLRGEVARHATILTRLVRDAGSGEDLLAGRPLNEAAGHSLGEIVAGFVFGIAWALGVWHFGASALGA